MPLLSRERGMSNDLPIGTVRPVGRRLRDPVGPFTRRLATVGSTLRCPQRRRRLRDIATRVLYADGLDILPYFIVGMALLWIAVGIGAVVVGLFTGSGVGVLAGLGCIVLWSLPLFAYG